MKHTAVIKRIMKDKKITQRELAQKMGFYGPSSISLRLTTRRNGTIMNTIDMLEALDYEMIIRPISKKPLGPGEYVLHTFDYIDGEEEE